MRTELYRCTVRDWFVLYRCVASNNIGNKRREAQSEAIALDITGPPQITSTIRNNGVKSFRECPYFCKNIKDL